MVALAALALGAAAPRRAPVPACAPVPGLPDDPVELELSQVPSAQAVELLFTDVVRGPFVVSPAVIADRRPVTVRIAARLGDARAQVGSYLAGLGFTVRREGCVDLIDLPRPPVQAAAAGPAPRVTRSFVYRPRWRDPSAIAAMLRGVFPEATFTGGASPAVPASAAIGGASSAGTAAASADALVFNGTASEIAKLRELLPELDVPEGEVTVRAVVYEVTRQASEANAFQLAVNILRSRVDLQINDRTFTPLQNYITVGQNVLDQVLAALGTDQRFQTVTSPIVRARSGARASFNVGAQVPVLGSVSYAGSAGGTTPVQSIEYKDSGVIFTVRPVVRDATIAVELRQELSDFVRTTTGVNTTPTLTRRSLDTELALASGEVVIIGGLTQRRTGNTSSGFSFLPSALNARQSTDDTTDILLVLSVERVHPAGSPALPSAQTVRAGASSGGPACPAGWRC